MKNSQPFISIITVVLNDSCHIEETILSVIDQSLIEKIQYIIIDGQSTDGTLDIIKQYLDKIDIFISENYSIFV